MFFFFELAKPEQPNGHHTKIPPSLAASARPQAVSTVRGGAVGMFGRAVAAAVADCLSVMRRDVPMEMPIARAY